MTTLFDLTAKVEAALRDSADPETGEISQDAIEALAAQHDKLVSCIAWVRFTTAESAARGQVLADMQAAHERELKGIAWMKSAIQTALTVRGLDTVTDADGLVRAKLYRGRDVSVQITDDAALPADVRVEIPASSRPDKAAIKKRLQAGEAVPGAALEYRDRLEIK